MLSSDPAFKPSAPPPPGPVRTEVPLGPGGPASPAPKASSSTPATPSSGSTVPPTNVSPTPPNPSKVQTAPPTSPSATSPPSSPVSQDAAKPAPPPPPSRPKRFRRVRLFLYLILGGALSYAGAVFFALRNDNFHDFFTEYVPFGEEAVLYFEERAFYKRFPHATQHVHRAAHQSAGSDNKVTIPSRSGLSWKVTEESKEGGSDLTRKGKHMSAVDAPVPDKKESKDPKTEAKQPASPEKPSILEKAPPPPPPQSIKHGESTQVLDPESGEILEKKPAPKPEKTSQAPQPSPATQGPKEDSRPPAVPPVAHLSPLNIPNADEPLVQELTKIVNDLITVVNADSADASNRYSAPINKAKDALAEVGNKILALKAAEREAAEERVKQAHKEFDEGAKQLLQRIEAAQREDDARYREEFEAERERLSRSYESRVKAEVERSQELAAQRLKNELTEQAIEMKRKFIDEIKSLVESEREGRLSKLSDLSTSVDSLTELTSNWNGVIDSNLSTQQLQVALDAVRSALNSSANPNDRPKPFVRELAALKLVADNDAVVDAAIASINPSAYQKGIPSSAQLIDRFRRVAGEVRKASLLPENAGVASHAASFMLSKVLFKKHGQPQGDDVESILTRTETLLEEGDLDSAAREMNQLQGWAGLLCQDWLGDVRKVLEVRQALDVVETEAKLRCLRVS